MVSMVGNAISLAKGWVQFPKLFGEDFLISLNDTAFQIGSIEIKWYGVIISLAVVLCIILGLRSCEKHGLTKDDVLDYIIFAIPSAIVGARLYYVIFEWDRYKHNLLSIFDYTNGGLAVYGGVIAALLALFFVSRYKKHSFLNVAGFAMPYIILGQAIGRWGNFFNQEAFGCETTLPWGMTGNKIQALGYTELVHPTFLYESLWCFAAFAVLMIYRKKWEKSDRECLYLYMILYGIERTVVEGLRTDSLYIGNTDIRVSQVLSAVLVIAGIALFIYTKVKQNKDPDYLAKTIRKNIEKQEKTEIAEKEESEEAEDSCANSENASETEKAAESENN